MKCICCGKETEYIIGGYSVCKEHSKELDGFIPFGILKQVKEHLKW